MTSSNCFPDRDVIPLETVSLTLLACLPNIHGPFIRKLTRENFYDMMSQSMGWNEELHQQEPRSPERYRMLQINDETIGFFAVRKEADHFYLHTIQLTSALRGKGYGTALLQYIEGIARSKGLAFIRLSVFKSNPAGRLYQRLGYRPILDDEERSLILMEKVL